jgi:hypothetical protein
MDRSTAVTSRAFFLLFALGVCAAAQAPAAPRPRVSARVTMQLDTATAAVFDARAFDLTVTSSTTPNGAEIQLVKNAGPHTGDLVQLSASGAHVPGVVIEVLDSSGTHSTFRLSDVTIVSDHVSLSTTRASLEQQRIAQQEALSSLSADFQDAERQQSMLEQLGRARGATQQDLARARDRATDLQRRIDLLRQRQTLLAGELAGHGPLDETIVLRFAHLEVDSPDAGGHAAVSFGRPLRH